MVDFLSHAAARIFIKETNDSMVHGASSCLLCAADRIKGLVHSMNDSVLTRTIDG